MEYRIIFYNASKTAICEKTIVRSLSPSGFTLKEVNAASTKQILGNYLSGGFLQNDFIIVVSGSNSGEDEAYKAISGALNSNKDVECEKIGDFRSYLFTCDSQALLLLPDIDSVISAVLDNHVTAILKTFFELSENDIITS